MIYSRAQLRDAVLGELGIIDPNEPPAPEDAVLANTYVQSWLGVAYDQGWIWWDPDADTIPERMFIPLAQWIADKLTLQYGATERASLLQAKSQAAEDVIVLMAEQANSGLTQTADYY